MLMAAARLNLPSVFLYGGSILPGHYKDQALDIVSVFEAVGACAAGTLTENELGEIEKRACPTEGSCAGHVHRQHDGVGGRGARHVAARQLGAAGRRPPARRLRVRERPRGDEPPRARTSGPRQIMTKEAFENAIAVGMALGGSTNLVLHLLAIAQRGRRRARARRLQPHRRAGPAHRRHEAARQVPHGRPRPHRRRAGGDARAARRRAAPRRLHHRHRADGRREPRRARPARARRRRRAPAHDADPHPGRHRGAHAARSRRTVAW